MPRKPHKARAPLWAVSPAPPSRVVIKGFTLPPEGTCARVDVSGEPVAVYNVRGVLFAIGAQCTHVGGPLDEGELNDHRVECPWHGSVFDIETGKVLRGPADTPVSAFRAFMDKEGLVLEQRLKDSGVPAGH
jgi:nitrite reductase/ring-hydroxylating ferredoxin subunit